MRMTHNGMQRQSQTLHHHDDLLLDRTSSDTSLLLRCSGEFLDMDLAPTASASGAAAAAAAAAAASSCTYHSATLSSVVPAEPGDCAADGGGGGGGGGDGGEGGPPAMSRAQLVRSLVFGGVDGLGTTLTLVWGSAALGSVVSNDTLLTLGVANLLAKGCSMGLGDYFGSQAEMRVAGGSGEGASRASGAVMFVSFVVFGGVPLLSLALAPEAEAGGGGGWGGDLQERRRLLLCVLCGASLFLLGLVKARMTATGLLPSALTMVAAGGATALTSYMVGHLVHHLLGVEED